LNLVANLATNRTSNNGRSPKREINSGGAIGLGGAPLRRSRDRLIEQEKEKEKEKE